MMDFLKTHGDHIAFDTGDFAGVREHFEAEGIALAQMEPTSRHTAMRWGFFDTVKDLGTTIEVFNAIEVAKIEAEKT